ncbi:hypothetical protein N8Z24_00180 [bacterium]|nr:hypothetical protein [bacterium]
MTVYIERIIKVQVIPGVEEDMVIRYSSEADAKSVEFCLKSKPGFNFRTDLRDLHKELGKFGGK